MQYLDNDDSSVNIEFSVIPVPAVEDHSGRGFPSKQPTRIMVAAIADADIMTEAAQASQQYTVQMENCTGILHNTVRMGAATLSPADLLQTSSVYQYIALVQFENSNIWYYAVQYSSALDSVPVYTVARLEAASNRHTDGTPNLSEDNVKLAVALDFSVTNGSFVFFPGFGIPVGSNCSSSSSSRLLSGGEGLAGENHRRTLIQEKAHGKIGTVLNCCERECHADHYDSIRKSGTPSMNFMCQQPKFKPMAAEATA
ncbi:hypothetical protein K440DRAFT_641580 [Wilcoxina mikolae CBS 423.85]|nr:hypothetical protein K440DRAFT_641580 [Wilcoxina mikolae CBS 423.85]